MELIHEDIATPLGTFRVGEAEGVLVAAAFSDGWIRVLQRVGNGSTVALPGRTNSGEAVRAYFAGDVRALEGLEVRLRGSDFQAAVWEALRRIPSGTTLSYARLAEAIGAPRAVRAVGTANGANPVSVIVPCHRVVRSDGSPGGYGGGPDRKRWLLEHEGALS